MSVYLDHNATTPIRPRAAEAVAAALATGGNASSVHGAGRAARRILDDAREAVATGVGARAEDVVFTSGGTEANNLALGNACSIGCDGGILVSAVEHASVLAGCPEARRVPVTADGVIDLDALEDMLKRTRPVLVSVMLANNETGVIQPVAKVAEIARARGALVHCDAVQALGKIPVDLAALGVHMLTVSAHKIGGPMGAGALVLAEDVVLGPVIVGGGQELGRRAGTENLPGIAGFGAAAATIDEAIADMPRLAALRDRMEAEITAAAPEARIFGRAAGRLANTSSLTMPGVDNQTQVMSFDLEGIAVSAGSACSSGKVGPSHVLEAMGVAEDAVKSAVRVSLGWTTTENDIETFIRGWKGLYARLGGGSLAA